MTEVYAEIENEGVNAWILQLTAGIYVAVGQFELVHIIDQADTITIPMAPEYCQHVVVWNNHILPVVNIASWLSGQVQVAQSTVAVVSYENAQNKLCYGGLALSAIPHLESVVDAQASELPKKQDKWSRISISCFMIEHGKRVPILDLSKLFELNEG